MSENSKWITFWLTGVGLLWADVYLWYQDIPMGYLFAATVTLCVLWMISLVILDPRIKPATHGGPR